MRSEKGTSLELEQPDYRNLETRVQKKKDLSTDFGASRDASASPEGCINPPGGT